MLRYCTLEFVSPAENLACDEALVDLAEENSSHPGFLRFFEASAPFVVLGYAKRVAEEVFEDECARRGVPIFRRCSGGGTVLQGPGCFNYSLVLPIDSEPGLETITGANRAIMERNRAAIAAISGEDVRIEGYTDLAIHGVKFSGNAQRRKKRCLLFHGALLLNFDLALVPELLREPAQQPEYRARRDHSAFIRNLSVSSAAVAEQLRKAWHADESGPASESKAIRERTKILAREKYATDEWNRKF